MKRSFAASLFVAALLGFPHFVASHDKTPTAAVPAAAAADARTAPAVAVVQQFSTALQKGDLVAAGALLTDDVLILESGGAERSRDEYLGHHAKGDAEFLKSAHVQKIRQTARVEGALAWVGTESEIHLTKDGKPVTLLSTETMILRQSAGAWRIVHIHWSSRPKK